MKHMKDFSDLEEKNLYFHHFIHYKTRRGTSYIFYFLRRKRLTFKKLIVQFDETIDEPKVTFLYNDCPDLKACSKRIHNKLNEAYKKDPKWRLRALTSEAIKGSYNPWTPNGLRLKDDLLDKLKVTLFIWWLMFSLATLLSFFSINTTVFLSTFILTYATSSLIYKKKDLTVSFRKKNELLFFIRYNLRRSILHVPVLIILFILFKRLPL